MKDTFIIRTEWFESISELDDTEQAMIFRNLFHFHNGEENLINLNNRAVKLVWKLLEPNLKRNIDNYDKRCETSANNGKLGGRPKKSTEENLNNLKKPNEEPNNFGKPNETLNDSVLDSDSEPVIDSEIDLEKEIPKEISPSDLENEKLRLEIEELRKHILDAENKERKSSAKKKERFEPPTVEDVENYFIENGFRKDSGTRAYNYYAIAEWRDSKGNQVKNWKQKMQAVWFKEENKIITNYAITNNTRSERTYGSAPEGKRGTHLIPIPNECDTSNERYEVEGFYYGDV